MPTGCHPSDATKKKISAALKGRPLSEETKQKISDAQRGKPKSELTKQRMREAARRITPAHRARIANSLRGRKLTAEHIANSLRGRRACGHIKPIGSKYNRRGYIWIKVSEDNGRNNYVAEHRMIMAAHLGRALSPDEHVHHINGNGLDNRIENLAIVSKREHALVAGLLLIMDKDLAQIIVKTIVARYPEITP